MYNYKKTQMTHILEDYFPKQNASGQPTPLNKGGQYSFLVYT